MWLITPCPCRLFCLQPGISIRTHAPTHYRDPTLPLSFPFNMQVRCSHSTRSFSWSALPFFPVISSNMRSTLAPFSFFHSDRHHSASQGIKLLESSRRSPSISPSPNRRLEYTDTHLQPECQISRALSVSCLLYLVMFQPLQRWHYLCCDPSRMITVSSNIQKLPTSLCWIEILPCSLNYHAISPSGRNLFEFVNISQLILTYMHRYYTHSWNSKPTLLVCSIMWMITSTHHSQFLIRNSSGTLHSVSAVAYQSEHNQSINMWPTLKAITPQQTSPKAKV